MKVTRFFDWIFSNYRNNSSISTNGTYSWKNTSEMWQISSKNYSVPFQNISSNSSVNINDISLLMFPSKLGYIVLWRRAFVNFEWSFPPQFPKNYKNKLLPILITITPEKSPIFSKKFVIPSSQAPSKNNFIGLYQVNQCQMLVRHCQLTQLNNKCNLSQIRT